ncbi:MAG: CHASE2 domain-containing protein, partial [Acidobacteriota bacterium]|nr:CHASE2 domain-containing protein [Acidobacteriota bacterium]
QAVDDIVLVAIDDSTASEYGPLPLRRSLLAQAVTRLASFGPKALAVDILLAEPGSPEDDAALARSFSQVPSLVLSAALGSDPRAAGRWILPLPPFADSHSIGHVHVEADADGCVRSILLEAAGGGRRYWALALQAVRAALRTGAPLERRDSLDLGTTRIPATAASGRLMAIDYAGPEGAFRRIPFAALLDNTAKAEDFRGKIVFLGATAQGSGDRLFTPFSSRIGMSGIEIHANIARTILDRAFLTPLSASGQFAVLALLAALCALGIGVLRGMRLYAVLAGMAILIVVCCYIALRLGWILPPGTLLAGFAAAAGVAGTGEYVLVAAALRRSERKQRDYAFRVQAIAHEIKTPLTAIQGSSEIISDQQIPDAQRSEIAGMIHRESMRLTQIIHTFLDVERMASGSLSLETQAIDLAVLCEDVLERARLYAARKAITIAASVAHVTVPADGDLLSFAIYNLLTNAVKYSPKRTAVTLIVEQRGTGAAISVVDQGYGIAPAEQKKIFDRFYRVRGPADNEEGTGIGLAMVKEIVTQHGGSVEVDSREGAGSRFTILLPGQGR